MNPEPRIWPPPPTNPPDYPTKPPKMPLSFSEKMGALSPVCVTLGFLVGITAPLVIPARECDSGICAPVPASLLYLEGGLYILSVLLALLGAILGFTNWRTIGGKIGIAFVALPLAVLLILIIRECL